MCFTRGTLLSTTSELSDAHSLLLRVNCAVSSLFRARFVTQCDLAFRSRSSRERADVRPGFSCQRRGDVEGLPDRDRRGEDRARRKAHYDRLALAAGWLLLASGGTTRFRGNTVRGKKGAAQRLSTATYCDIAVAVDHAVTHVFLCAAGKLFRILAATASATVDLIALSPRQNIGSASNFRCDFGSMMRGFQKFLKDSIFLVQSAATPPELPVKTKFTY